MKKRSIWIILLLVCVAVGAFILFPLFSHIEEDEIPVSSHEIQEIEPPKPVEIEIVCAGDVMGHMSQLKAQRVEDGTYDFTNNFKYVKKYIQAADLAICNVETTFAGEPYTGYPAFSSPDAMAEALHDAGFDVASTANNHMVDRGLKGVLRTLEVLQGYGLKTTGSVMNPGDANEPVYAMYRTKGIDIAVIGYTYQTPTGNGKVAINGSVISDELASHINSFSYSSIDDDLEKINDSVKAAKAAGADIVILFYHWGEEYQTSANKWQKYIAEKTVEMMDVDIIFGSHPHVLQEAEMLANEVPVFYSLGNFISNQRTETLDNRYTEEGAIARVRLSIMEETGEIQWIKMDAIPTWVDRHSENGRYYYHIIPLDEDLKQNETLAVSGHLSRAERAWEDANGILKIN